jgi:AcrR family transcriptional regulator
VRTHREDEPRTALSRSQIVQAALLIADEEGLEAVSMRRLARELCAGAMSLYHYFQSRDELLGVMGDTVAAELPIPGAVPEDWREALRTIAHRSRAAFRRHPWLRVNPHLLRSSQSIATLAEAGHDADRLAAIVLAVDDYTIGYTLREPAARDGGIAGEPDFDAGLNWLLDGFAAQLGL